MRNLSACLVLLAASLAAAAPTVDRKPGRVDVSLPNGVALSFALEGDELLGLRTAAVDGVPLKSDATVVRPLLLQDRGDRPVAWERLRLRDVSVDGDAVKLQLVLGRTDGKVAWPRWFVMQGDAIHIDYYRFQHVRLPSEVISVDALQPWLKQPGDLSAGGTLTWVIESVTTNVAGWTWRGWKHHYEFALEGGKVNVLRELGTWEVGGTAPGATLVNLRYRGLGGIVNKLPAMAIDAQAVDASFTTTEIIPGAVDKAPVVSPAIPGRQDIATRAEGMKYRHGAWIAQLQRGGGVNWVDYQYRPEVALAAFYERMDAIRSMTEVWPGDKQVSQTDCLYFPLTDRGQTVPKLHLALVTKANPLPEHESRTRWQEMDDFVRELISAELKFVRTEPLPSAGIGIDSGWEGKLKAIDAGADSLAQAGVRRILTHHPGWFNGRGLRQKETSYAIPQRMQTDPKKPNEPPAMKNDTGGDCSIHDYVPQSDKTRDAWLAMSTTLRRNRIEHWAWVTGMLYGTGPVVQQFGEARFTKNAPEVDFSSGYPGEHGRAGHRGIPIVDGEIRAWWFDRMSKAIDDLGVDGFWADSFQNMFMSQMNYQRDDWSPNVRQWWEVIAEHSRKGAGWMSESTAFPALSCSIEVGGNPEDFEGVWWTLRYVTRWYRGSDVAHKGTDKADRLYFRSMANKGPIAPGLGHGPYTGAAVIAQVPRFAEYSKQYMLALPAMRRPFQLADDGGVLWLTFAGDGTGVLFSFADQPVPAGVKARDIVAGAAADKLAAHATYRVEAADLIAAFGLRRGDAKDPRIGQKWTGMPIPE
jgi:hypothetical protein